MTRASLRSNLLDWGLRLFVTVVFVFEGTDKSGSRPKSSGGRYPDSEGDAIAVTMLACRMVRTGGLKHGSRPSGLQYVHELARLACNCGHRSGGCCRYRHPAERRTPGGPHRPDGGGTARTARARGHLRLPRVSSTLR